MSPYWTFKSFVHTAHLTKMCNSVTSIIKTAGKVGTWKHSVHHTPVNSFYMTIQTFTPSQSYRALWIVWASIQKNDSCKSCHCTILRLQCFIYHKSCSIAHTHTHLGQLASTGFEPNNEKICFEYTIHHDSATASFWIPTSALFSTLNNLQY